MKKITFSFLILLSTISLLAQDIPMQDENQVGYAGGVEGEVYVIPGKIEIEYFDVIQGDPLNDSATYHENNTRRGGAHQSFRIDNAANVDFQRDASTDNPHYTAGDTVTWIGWAHVGEWWEYTVNVQEKKKYNLTVSYNSDSENSTHRKFVMYVDDTMSIVADTFHLNRTDGFWNPTSAAVKDTMISTNINLTEGTHVLRIRMITPNINFDFITFAVEGDYEGSSAKENIVSNSVVYPNPASDVISLSQVADVEIYNISGQLEISVANATTIDVSNLNRGVYILKTSTGLVTKLLKE